VPLSAIERGGEEEGKVGAGLEGGGGGQAKQIKDLTEREGGRE